MRPFTRLRADGQPVNSRCDAPATSATSPGLKDDDNARFRLWLTRGSQPVTPHDRPTGAKRQIPAGAAGQSGRAWSAVAPR